MNLEDLINEPPAPTEFPSYLLTDPEVVGYPDTEMQNQIYGWVARTFPSWENLTVLDVGCGRGDIHKELKGSNYIGVETNRVLCEAGQKLYSSNPRFKIFNYDFFDTDFEQVDVSVVIGTLNNMDWASFKKMFDALTNISRKAVIFIVNSESDDPELTEFPFIELFNHIPQLNEMPFEIDHTMFNGIYKLVVYK
jgi:SAM-dependent methyltransferase